MRALALVSLLVPLAVGGYLLTGSLKSAGTATKTGDDAAELASSQAAVVNLQTASTTLEGSRAATGTYAGTVLPGSRLVRADAASYCVETGSGPAVFHLAGPGGSPAPGPCG